MRITDPPASRNYQEISAYEEQKNQKVPTYGKQNEQKQNSVSMPKKPSAIRRKQLNYNSREIRGFLMRAVRSQAAGLVLNTAKSKLVNLLKCKGTGMYNESELNAAIVHARRMVRCAQLKYRNLTREEEQNRHNEKASEKEARDPRIGHVQKALRLKQRRLALEQKRRIHRNLEQAKMNQADREYQSKRAQDQNNHKNPAHFSAGGSDLSELKLRELELEISREGALLAMEAGGGADFSGDVQIAPGAAFVPLTDTPSASFDGMAASADAAGGAIDIGL